MAGRAGAIGGLSRAVNVSGASGYGLGMEPSQEVVNDQTGEASQGVVAPAEGENAAEVPASPTPEPPETAETTQAAEEQSRDH